MKNLPALHPIQCNDERREQYSWAGWSVDDDEPKPPELDPMASAQARRAWRPPGL
jgi:hypothetical protein